MIFTFIINLNDFLPFYYKTACAILHSALHGADRILRITQMAGSGERIKALMEALGLSQAELARKTGVSDSCVSGWLNKDRRPQRRSLEILCALGGYSEDFLLKGAPAAASAPRGTNALDRIMADAKLNVCNALGVPPDRVQLTLQVVS